MAENHLQVDNGLQINLAWTFQATHQALNVCHAILPAGLTVTVTLADAITNALNALYVSSGMGTNQPTTTRAPSAQLRDLRQANLPLVPSTIPGSAGTTTGDPLPASVAAVMSLRTARAGRSFRGRCYIPGWGEGANDATGHIGTAAKAALDAWALGFLSAINQQGLQLAVLKRPIFGSNGAITVPGVLTPVTQATIRDVRWDSQRRRLGR
jgi:hypothetical protein